MPKKTGKIPVYKSTVNMGISGSLPYKRPDYGAAQMIAKSGKMIGDALQQWGKFAMRTQQIDNENTRNKVVADFRSTYAVMEQGLRDEFQAQPQGYTPEWKKQSDELIKSATEGLDGQLKERITADLTNFVAGQVEGQLKWEQESWWDHQTAQADENLRIQTASAALEGDDFTAHQGFMEAIDGIDRLMDLGALSQVQGQARKNKAYQDFEYTRGRKLILSNEPFEGPMEFIRRANEGEYEHLTPTVLQSLIETAQNENESRIRSDAALATKREKDEAKRLKEMGDRSLNNIFDEYTDMVDADPMKHDVGAMGKALTIKVNRLTDARMITSTQAMAMKKMIQAEVRAEAFDNETYNSHWKRILDGRGVDRDQLLEDLGNGLLNATAVKELIASGKTYHFTNDNQYKIAMQLIKTQFGIKGQAIFKSLEVKERETLMLNAQRTLYENAMKEKGKINHVELANRIIEKQARRIKTMKDYSDPGISPGIKEKKKKKKTSKKRSR